MWSSTNQRAFCFLLNMLFILIQKIYRSCCCCRQKTRWPRKKSLSTSGPTQSRKDGQGRFKRNAFKQPAQHTAAGSLLNALFYSFSWKKEKETTSRLVYVETTFIGRISSNMKHDERVKLRDAISQRENFCGFETLWGLSGTQNKKSHLGGKKTMGEMT